MIFLNTIAAASPRYRQTEPVGYSLTILSPTEGEEVTADFTASFKDSSTLVSITSPTEGQEVTANFKITFNAE